MTVLRHKDGVSFIPKEEKKKNMEFHKVKKENVTDSGNLRIGKLEENAITSVTERRDKLFTRGEKVKIWHITRYKWGKGVVLGIQRN